MEFKKQKQNHLSKKDHSDKGGWDEKIKKLCKKINSKQEFYTTSSCAGRILLIKAQEKKAKGLFLFRAHEKISLNQLKKELQKIIKSKNNNKDLIYFKQEPCIIHIASNSLENAQKILDKAKLTGWKRSGIISTSDRFVVEAISTEKLELPIIEKSKLLVSEDYLKLLVKEANQRLERTWKKINAFEKII
jgi:tRNA wybutosine-synthesizing protein 3